MRIKELWDIINTLTDKSLFSELTSTEKAELIKARTELAAIECSESAERLKKMKQVQERSKKVNRQFKRDEDWFAKDLGAERRGHMRRGLAEPDFVNDMFSFEHTRTSMQLAFIKDKLAEAKAHATQGRIPIVIITPRETERKDSIVVMSYQDFRELHGK